MKIRIFNSKKIPTNGFLQILIRYSKLSMLWTSLLFFFSTLGPCFGQFYPPTYSCFESNIFIALRIHFYRVPQLIHWALKFSSFVTSHFNHNICQMFLRFTLYLITLRLCLKVFFFSRKKWKVWLIPRYVDPPPPLKSDIENQNA